jgi:thioredoxin-like negative regulator of GroEL
VRTRSPFASPVVALLIAVGSVLTATEVRAQTPAAMRALARQVALDFTHRATMAERAGQLPAAEDFFARAMQADPGYLPPYLGYARLLATRHHADESAMVLSRIPNRAVESDRDVIDIARVRAQVGDVDGAIEMLAAHTESAETTRARADVASAAGRFPEALLAARHLADMLGGDDPAARDAALLVRALVILVGDADAVHTPGNAVGPLRRLLAE